MVGQPLETIEGIYRRATDCSDCFATGYLKRSFVDIAQPRFVGHRYWSAQRRFVFLSINPGAGSGSAEDQKMLADVHAFKNGNLSLETLFVRQRGYFPYWGRGKFLPYFRKIGIEFDEIALLNLAQCATEGDKYPSVMLHSCMERHTLDLIAALRPDILVACGKRVQEVAGKMGLCYVGIPHFAARTNINFAEVRQALGMSQLDSVPAKHASMESLEPQAFLPKRHDRIIRLLEPINPKSGMSRHRYDCYRDGMTEEDYICAVKARCGAIEAKKCKADLKWDAQRNFIRIQLG